MQYRNLLSKTSKRSPFFHYNASFDPIEVVRGHMVDDLEIKPGYLTNFLGVVIDPRFFPSILNDKAGSIEDIPIPANWHADMAEWGFALRSIDLARGSFTMIELGCGWGCWMNNTGVAARRRGLKVHVIGVEADEGVSGSPGKHYKRTHSLSPRSRSTEASRQRRMGSPFFLGRRPRG
jgi:hypothetical protein